MLKTKGIVRIGLYAKSPFYNQFLKDLENDPFLAKQYAEAPRGEKANVRVEHFAQKGALLAEEIKSIIRLTITEWSDAQWFTPRQLNRELGYDPEATVNWIESCIEKGPTEYKLNVL